MAVLSELTSFPKFIDAICFNETGHLAVAASNLIGRTWNGLLAVYNDPKFAPHLPHIECASQNEAGCTDVHWIDDNQLVIGTDAGTVEVWKTNQQPLLENSVMLAEHDDLIAAISVSKRLKQIASASWDGCIKLWDLEVDMSIHSIRIHSDKVLDIKWNENVPDVFASASEDGTVKMYDNRCDRRPVTVLLQSDKYFPTCVNWSSEQNICVGFSGGQLDMYDSRKPLNNVMHKEEHSGRVNKVISFRNSYVATASDDMTVKVYDMKLDFDVVYTDNRHSDFVKGLAFCKKDNSLWTSGWDGTILSHAPAEKIK